MTFPHSDESGVESKRLDDQESVYRAGEQADTDKEPEEATGAAIGGEEGTVDGQ